MTSELVRFLSTVSLFEALSDSALEEIARKGTELCFGRDEAICRQGDPGKSLFVVSEGILQVYVEAAGERRVLAHLRRGDYFGEMAILTGLPRSASVSALAPARVFGLSKDDFEEVCRSKGDIALDIIRTLSMRLAKSNVAGVKPGGARVIVLLATEPRLGRTTLGANLALALSRFEGGTVALFDPRIDCADGALLFGVADRVDVASELVATGRVELDRFLVEPRPRLVLLPPQLSGGPVLQEFHQHIPYDALRARVDTVIVDSSSTVAGLNREMIREAETILIMVAASAPDLTARVEQVFRMVLTPAGVDSNAVKLVVVQRGGDDEPSIPAGLVGDVVLLPPAPASVGDRPLVVEACPEEALSRTVECLARSLGHERTIEVFVTVPATTASRIVEDALKEMCDACRDVLQRWAPGEGLPEGLEPVQSGNSVFVLQGQCSDPVLRRRLGDVVKGALELKRRLSVEQVYLRMGGRVDAI